MADDSRIPHVLLVEDDPIVARLTARHLELGGCQVTAVGSAAAALEAVRATPELDLVLLDHGLPDLDGVEATQRLRAHDPTHRLAIVWLTGDPGLADHPLAASADGVAIKPLAGAELRALVRDHLPPLSTS